MPAVLHDAIAGAYADALLPIFGWMVPLFVLTSVVALLLPEVPLSRKTGMEQIAEAERAGSEEVDGERAERAGSEELAAAGVGRAEESESARTERVGP